MTTTNRPDPGTRTLQERLLFFDLTTDLFMVASSFIERTRLLEALDVVFGLVVLAAFAARLLLSRTCIRDLLQPATWADGRHRLFSRAARRGRRRLP